MKQFLFQCIHRFIAIVLRKFWSACPVCHTYFGGHQQHHHSKMIKGVNYRLICGTCHDDHHANKAP